MTYQDIASQAAASVGIDANIFLRQIQQESGFNPNAKSPAGAEGIAQFMPATAVSMGVDPWNPTQALNGAARLDKNNLNKYGGDYAKALAAYNAGGGAVDNAVANYGASWLAHMPAETQNYVKAILGGSNVDTYTSTSTTSNNTPSQGGLLQPVFDSLRSWGIHIALIMAALMFVLIGFWILTQNPQDASSSILNKGLS